MTAGGIYTIAGDGANGFAGDGGPAASAELDLPAGVTIDAAGNLVIADSGSEHDGRGGRVQVVAARSGRFYGQAMTAGDIYTVAGDGTFGVSGDGGPGARAELDSPAGRAVGGAGQRGDAET